MPPGFLQLIPEKNIKSDGLVPSEKIEHRLYQLILSHSTFEDARNFRLYSYQTEYSEFADIQKIEIFRSLQKLEKRNIIRQVFIVTYDKGRNYLYVIPYFLASKESESIDEIISAIVEISSLSIEQYIQTLPELNKWNAQVTLESEFEGRFKSDASSTVFLDVLRFISIENFSVPIENNYLDQFKSLIKEKLVERKAIIDIPKFGMIPLKGNDYIALFELVCSFLEDLSIKTFGNNKHFERCSQKIDLESKLHYEDPSSSVSVKFCIDRARLYEMIMQDQFQKKDYNGHLGPLILYSIKEMVQEKYEDRKRQENGKNHEEILKGLLDPERNGLAAILFLQQADLESLPNCIWEKLINNENLVYANWEFPEGTIHALSKKEIHHFKQALSDIESLPAHMQWQILLLKALIEKEEDDLPGLFNDRDFVRKYGRLLRSVYIPYIPWYYKIFILLGLSWFQDKAFPIAKQKIQLYQEHYQKKNASKIESLKKKREEQVKKQRSEIELLEQRNIITAKLDELIFRKHFFPSRKELKDLFPEYSPNAFEQIIKEGRFQKVVYKSQLENGDNTLILQPYDSDWLKIINQIVKIVNQYNQIDYEKMENGLDFQERIKAIKKYIEKSSSKLNMNKKIELDPYKKLEHEIAKNELRKKQDFSKYL